MKRPWFLRSRADLLSERIDICNQRIDALRDRPWILDLKPDSIIVFEFPNRVPRDVVERIKKQWEPYAVMICEGGVKMKVVSQDEASRTD